MAFLSDPAGIYVHGSFHCFSRECAALWTHVTLNLAIFILTCGLEVWELNDCHQHFFLLNFLYFDPGE